MKTALVILLLAVGAPQQAPKPTVATSPPQEPALITDSWSTGRVNVITMPICGWVGALVDGKCKVTITFLKEYPPVTCVTKPKKVGEAQVVECTWEPPKEAVRQ